MVMVFEAKMNNTGLIETGKTLLDFNQKLDIGLLDNVVSCMYTGAGQQQQIAQQILTRLKEHPEAWTRVDAILEYSSNQQTKYFALQILENLIKSRWKVLPREQCEGIKQYIVNLIINTSSSYDSLDREKVYLAKLNIILVQIVKREWPKNWPQFISELVGASKANESLCQNNMAIMKLLSEEVFDFSSGEMTHAKAKHLKETICAEFQKIFELCLFVLESSANVSLIRATLETLLKFLSWIPLGYIFETSMVKLLLEKFLPVTMFRNVTLQCLTEISAIQGMPNYNAALVDMFLLTLSQLKIMLPLVLNIQEAYARGTNDEQNFIQNLALFLCTFLKEHGALVEFSPDHRTALLEALQYLLMISEVDEKEVFKVCLEYWNHLASSLYRESPFPPQLGVSVSLGLNDSASSRRQLYNPVLSRMRYVMISRMARPEEVLVVENEQGEVVREFMKDTDQIELYKNMRETLVYLTHLDYNDTESIMLEKLGRQMDGSEWSWKNLNTLCWAVGSISGAFNEDDEKRFLVIVIKDLLSLCEAKRGKDNKAIVASNIMYIVGQYPRFLRAHWRFLKTVVNKLFEFMHELHEGVQDMACDTFIKIASRCRRHFIQIQLGEVMPFVDEILNTINSIICDLQPHQVHTFYEAVGLMIAAQTDQPAQQQLIVNYMLLPNQTWDSIVQEASKNVQVLREVDYVKQLSNIIKTNVRACKSVGHAFVVQLSRIYLDMLNVYKELSENISNAVQANGEEVTKQHVIKCMRTVKKETLRLIATWVGASNDPRMVVDHFVPPLLDAVLLDYRRNVPVAREPEVLSTMAVIVNQLADHITPRVIEIFDAVFEVTLDMINTNFEDFPEHRANFYLLLEAIVTHCFGALIQLNTEQFKLVFDSIVWAFKHTMRDVADTGLSIMQKLLISMEKYDSQAQAFYQAFYMDIMRHLFSIVTDSSHQGGLSMLCQLLAHLFHAVETDVIHVPLHPDAVATGNVVFVTNFVCNMLKNAFPHLNDQQIKVFVDGLFSFDQDATAFRENLRDFLVEIREFVGENDSDLYLEEREQAIKQAREEKRRLQLAVPGIINPYDMPDVE